MHTAALRYHKAMFARLKNKQATGTILGSPRGSGLNHHIDSWQELKMWRRSNHCNAYAIHNSPALSTYSDEFCSNDASAPTRCIILCFQTCRQYRKAAASGEIMAQGLNPWCKTIFRVHSTPLCHSVFTILRKSFLWTGPSYAMSSSWQSWRRQRWLDPFRGEERLVFGL
ncbi:uncharacterized protein MYCFIDRAFT_179079 [Pseudocercospora fijiensis CIRAD86]|uniref:Uncharacterized protein n=1 Tax=Pseudocercospora fijiensis (strain CIRAD86) TaxID=383855 RepID=M3AK68_PSEFD|nr:uncharacterized protein MYCFIDRAFT_179079 [Pseudocercospora fijiensis CIRAD86]EME77563.1 hypothetical protein MYCFIDRAFT_179079 [Pseudocercospora fijiensis CIRAD86]